MRWGLWGRVPAGSLWSCGAGSQGIVLLGLVLASCYQNRGGDDDDASAGGEGEGEGSTDGGPALQGDWQTERVGPVGEPGSKGGDSSVAIGVDGFVRIAFCASAALGEEGGLRYAGKLHGEWRQRSWSMDEGIECEGPSLLLPGDGALSATASGSGGWLGDSSLIMATGGDEPVGINGGQWGWTFGINPSLQPRGSTALVWSAEDRASVAFHDSPSGALWNTFYDALPETVDAGCPATADVSAMYDAGGDLRLAWTACRELRVGRRTDLGWSVETIGVADDFGFGDTALGMDSEGFLHVLHRHGAEVGHASDETGAWVLDVVDGTGDAIDVTGAVGLDDVVHAAWIDDSGTLHHAAREDGSWRAEVVGAATSDCALAAGPNGAVAITYRSGTDLWLASLDPAGAAR